MDKDLKDMRKQHFADVEEGKAGLERATRTAGEGGGRGGRRGRGRGGGGVGRAFEDDND